MENQVTVPKHKQFVYIAYACYIASTIFGGIPSIVGLIIAYMKRGEVQGTLYADHYTFLIRTFWISFIFGLIGLITTFIGIGLLIMAVVAIWFIFRTVAGVIRLHSDRPVNPTGWLI